VKVVVLMPYANPHVLSWIKLLKPNIELEIICVESVQSFRKGYFEEYDFDPDIFYLFKRNRFSNKKFQKMIRRADVFISLGIFYYRFFKSLILLKKECRVFILSEPFNPINSVKYINLRKLIAASYMLVKNNINFLAIGGEKVKDYYMEIGFKNSVFYNFGYFSEVSYVNRVSNQESNNIRFLFVGQLIPRKGIEKLVDIIKYLNNNFPEKNWTFEIIGEGKLSNYLLNEIAKLDNNKIKYLGLINNSEELNTRYFNSDILIVPSIFDGWGAVVSEGISAGLAIIASDNVFSANWLVDHGVNGFKFDYENFDEIRLIFDDIFSYKYDVNELKFNSKVIGAEWNASNAAKLFLSLIQNNKMENNSLLKIL
jgi:glycosyltransferase involved in cell wall biosynthesis